MQLRFYFLCSFCIYCNLLFAQKTPTSIPFQGIAKDFNGSPVMERKIYLQTTLIAGSINGKAIYTEEHETTTDAIGVFSIQIGQGRKTQGMINSLTEIAWDQGPYFLGIQLAITPNAPIQNWQYQNNWTNMGTTSLGIVPYAFYAMQTSGLDKKLNIADTLPMLRNYLKIQDTSAMLADYAKTIFLSTFNNSSSSNINTPNVNTNNVSIFNGEYDSLKNKPTLFSGIYDSLKNKPLLFSGAYSDLTGKPNLFDGNYTSLINKPSLFDGNYNSLSNKPILFSGAYSDLTGKPNLFDGNYNSLTNTPVLFDGDYNTLINKPSLFNGDYNSLINKPVLALNGDITNNGNITTLANSGVTSGTYGNGLQIPILSIDEKGRITAASTSTITPNSFPNKTNAQKNAMSNISTGTVIWCSDCGTRGQMQVYNGYEWTDLTGAPALTNDISFGTISSSNVSSYTASITSTINTDGGNTITARGIVWNTSINPIIALSTKTSSGTGTGTISASLTGLSASTVYYVRTYATNSNGTVYGNEISFTTTGIIPSLTTTAASSININGFTTGGNISSDGGNLVTYRGICWSTTANPTINDNRIISGTGTGTFTITLSNLNVATTYYVRAFATNSAGTAYGNQQTINTSSLVAGTSYQGGRIAYIFQSGDAGYVAGETHGFIIMNHPMGMQAAFGGYNPTTGYYSYTGTSMNFGTGRANTQKMSTMTWNNAAKYIYNVNYDGYNDWYLPSYYEWNKIGPNWTSLGIAYGSYQSSSELDNYNSAYFNVYNSYGWISASMSNSGKTSLYDVIGIRNF